MISSHFVHFFVTSADTKTAILDTHRYTDTHNIIIVSLHSFHSWWFTLLRNGSLLPRVQRFILNSRKCSISWHCAERKVLISVMRPGPRAPLRALVMHLYNSDRPISARNGVHVTSHQVLQAGGAPGRVEKLEDAV